MFGCAFRGGVEEMLGKIVKYFRLLLLGANVLCVVLLVMCSLSVRISPVHAGLLVAFGLSFPVYLVPAVFFLVLWLIFKPHYSLISLAGLIIAWPSVRAYCPINFPNPHPKGCIKVVSFNSKAFSLFESARQGSLETRSLDYVMNSHADIICIQEAGCWNDDYGRRAIARLRKLPYFDTLRVGKDNALGFATRFKVLKKERVVSNLKEHGSVAYTLAAEGDTIIVINNHFVSNNISPEDKVKYKKMVEAPSDSSMPGALHYFVKKVGEAGMGRAQQADLVEKYIEQHSDRPIILCGDFNDSPISYIHYTLTRRLRDAYTMSGIGPGISYHEAGMYFRLDNILCSRHWKAYDAKVETGKGSSDHYPISCYLKLKKRKM